MALDEDSNERKFLYETQRIYDRAEELWKVADADKNMASALNAVQQWIFELQDKIRDERMIIGDNFWDETASARSIRKMNENENEDESVSVQPRTNASGAEYMSKKMAKRMRKLKQEERRQEVMDALAELVAEHLDKS